MWHDNGCGKQEVRREVFDDAICSSGADEAECLCVSVALPVAERRPACVQNCADKYLLKEGLKKQPRGGGNRDVKKANEKCAVEPRGLDSAKIALS